MDFLGYSTETPSTNRNGTWDALELNFQDEKAFCNATSMIFSSLKNSASRGLIIDPDNEKFFVDILDVRYNSIENKIKIWPHYCKNVKK
jgi:hypothetical protein